MKSRNSNQQGFTLIEVSLAIVIGVIVLGGAITLYNQTKVSAGNGKAQEKVVGLMSLVEEQAAVTGGAYPSVGTLITAWQGRREDAGGSPWGGPANPTIASMPEGAGTTAYAWTTTTGAGHTAAWGTLAVASASVGSMLYATGPVTGTTTIYDGIALATRSFDRFVVGIVPPKADGVIFIQGGK